MSVLRHLRRLTAGVAIGAVLLSGSSFADIKSFNDAMIARDYKKAAAEAAATWPTLDMSRDDIPIIAREFGFAAYVSGDFAAAKMYGEAAVAGGIAHNEAAELRAGSEVLLRLADLKLAPTKAKRDLLYAALNARAEKEGLDLISYFGADVLTAYDFDNGSWSDAVADAALGERLTDRDEAYAAQVYRFGLFRHVARYMGENTVEVYKDVYALRQRMIAAINAAPNDEDVAALTAFYWEIYAWETSMETHLLGRRKLQKDQVEALSEAAKKSRSINDRATRLLTLSAADDPCETRIEMRRTPSYPSSARYKGLIGTVILRVDIDAKGVAKNPKILAAVPETVFGDAVMKTAAYLRFVPGKTWSSSCSLAKPGNVTTFVFSIR